MNSVLKNYGDFSTFKFYTVDELTEMAKDKYGVSEISVAIQKDNVNIVVLDTDETDNKTAYSLDPVKGISEDENETEKDDSSQIDVLPETGRNPMTDMLAKVCALFSMAAGTVMLKKI